MQQTKNFYNLNDLYLWRRQTMKVVVVKSPKILSGLLRVIFKIEKTPKE